MSTIRQDLDRIANLPEEGWTVNEQYHEILLRHLPPRLEAASDTGCGTGSFSRCLAERACRVVALDLSPRMIEVARECSGQYQNIHYVVEDAVGWEAPGELFDCVVSIAMLHHVDAEAMLRKMARLLRQGGTLAILDLYQVGRLRAIVTAGIALPARMLLRLIKTGSARAPRAAREAWAEHGRHDTYLTLPEVRGACEKALPGARVRQHLLWRYSILWRKPGWPSRSTSVLLPDERRHGRPASRYGLAEGLK